ncbi:MAG: peptidylprolyl isomerase [Acidobacteria bacterium]|nr:peptidylprolyl isomerase [Acidobacteriota bacterium]
MNRIFLLLAIAATLSARERPKGLYAIFETTQGTFTARLFEKDVPNTVQNFVAVAQGTKPTLDPKTRKLVSRRFYDGLTFHRVVRDEMIQAGDPTGTGSFPCGFTIQDEIMPGLRFDGAGVLAMANGGQPNSGSCQFFVTVGPMRQWNGNYTVFGTVVDGMKVVETINRMPGRGDRPVDPVKLISVTIERVGPEPQAKSKR